MDTERPQRVDYRVRDGRYGAGRARFARAFYAERIAGRRDRTVVEPDLGHAIGPRHFVMHGRAMAQLARGRVVDRMLAQDLPDALRDAAVQLAVEQDVIDDPTAIVHRGVAQDFDDARLRVDLDLGHVCAAGKGARQRDLAARVESAPVFLREVLHSDRDIGAFHAVATHFPRFFASPRRASKVFHSACFTASSTRPCGSPLSYTE